MNANYILRTSWGGSQESSDNWRTEYSSVFASAGYDEAAEEALRIISAHPEDELRELFEKNASVMAEVRMLRVGGKNWDLAVVDEEWHLTIMKLDAPRKPQWEEL